MPVYAYHPARVPFVSLPHFSAVGGFAEAILLNVLLLFLGTGSDRRLIVKMQPDNKW